ncbi:MAG: DUF2161 family putative PD-(D/E)XK-type phosphodiesterase [Rhodospirillales bacterium]|nr:DUF2161 family putative PD-(D/E)XK-type phosphodiesterase [Rhodospirillales bacterium]
MKETDLYNPVKALLVSRGYQVKAEINGCDIVASKNDVSTIIIELKLSFSLELVLQGISRQNLTDDVYLDVLAPDTSIKRKNWRSRERGYIKLCRMLGLGLMLVSPKKERGQQVKTLLDPVPYSPRKSKRQQTRLMTEFSTREGDPNTGGINRTKIITAYRQDALRCAVALSTQKKMKVAEIKTATGVIRTGSILQKNYYNWFERTERGIYCLTPSGKEGLKLYAKALPTLIV